MYNFLTYKAVYQINDITKSQQDELSSFFCTQAVYAKYDTLSGLYEFTLENRGDVLINGESPKNAMDIFMTKIGNAIFPITFRVDKYRNIKAIKEFESYRLNWENTVEHILDEYNRTLYVSNYIEMSRKNIESENNLIVALQRNTFTKHFLLSDSITSYVLCGFPESLSRSVLDVKTLSDDGLLSSVELSDTSTSGNLTVVKNEFGIMEKCNASFHYSDDGITCNTRHINIDIVAGSQKISKRSWLTF